MAPSSLLLRASSHVHVYSSHLRKPCPSLRQSCSGSRGHTLRALLVVASPGRGWRGWPVGPLLGAQGGGRVAAHIELPLCRFPVSATASSPRPASGPSTRRPGARRCSRSPSSSRWTSPTARAGRPRRRTASTPSRSRFCQVSCWPRARAPATAQAYPAVSPRPEPPLQEGRGDHSDAAAEHTRPALHPALVR